MKAVFGLLRIKNQNKFDNLDGLLLYLMN